MRAAQIFFETFCIKQSLRRKCERNSTSERGARHLFELTVCDNTLLTLQFVHEENVTRIRWGKDGVARQLVAQTLGVRASFVQVKQPARRG